MQPRIALRKETGAALDLARESPFAGKHVVGARSQRIPAALHAAELHQQPVLLRPEILQQARPPAKVVDDYLKRAVVIEIAGC